MDIIGGRRGLRSVQKRCAGPARTRRVGGLCQWVPAGTRGFPRECELARVLVLRRSRGILVRLQWGALEAPYYCGIDRWCWNNSK